MTLSLRKLGLLAGVALLAGAALAGVAGHAARAQSVPSSTSSCCTDTTCTPGACTDFNGGAVQVSFNGPSGAVTVQKTEPATGFIGACRVPFITYAPQLPSVCYSPAGATYGFAMTTFAVSPASAIARPYLASGTSIDSYDAIVTCYQPKSDGTCPAPSYPVSHSCCDYGMNMTSLDGKVASAQVFISR
jgi:hypothetical protein